MKRRSIDKIADRAMRFAMVLLVLLAPVVAWAGDPCPIEFRFVDLGSPAWLRDDPPLAKLKRQETWVGIKFGQDEERVVIRLVHEGSPAARATIQKDDVVTAVNGQAIRTRQELAARLDQFQPGEPITLSVQRGEMKLALQVKTERRDPLIFDLVDATDEQECAVARYERSSLLDDKRVESAVFGKGRGFRCSDAHQQLMLTGLFNKGDIVIVRGAHRVLIATVRWQTTCVDAADYDSAGGRSIDRTKRLFDRISSRYVDDRFRNP
jgi:membrane-associated protease RseP (regulator of RpoE activity)